jgi:hypothetical protein
VHVSISAYLVVAIECVLLFHFLLSSNLLRHRDAAFQTYIWVPGTAILTKFASGVVEGIWLNWAVLG